MNRREFLAATVIAGAATKQSLVATTPSLNMGMGIKAIVATNGGTIRMTGKATGDLCPSCWNRAPGRTMFTV